MNLSKSIISIAVASMVGAAGYAFAQQTDSNTTGRDGTVTGTNNPNSPRGGVGGTPGTMDSTGRMNNNGTVSSPTMRDGSTGQTSRRINGEPRARADRN